MSDIRLSPKHGLNPSIGVCSVCGNDDGTVVIPGLLKGDAEAPRRAVWSNEPCPTCKSYMAMGIILISVRDGEKGATPYRTGRFCVVKEEAIRRLFNPSILDTVLTKRVCYVEDSTWKALGLPTEPTPETPNADTPDPSTP